MMEQNKINLAFLSIDRWNDDQIVKPIEKEVKGKDFISWGDKNDYPDYLEDLYQNASTLKTLIDGLSDYVCGNGIEIKTGLNQIINKYGETIEDIITNIVHDYVQFGGFALNIIKNKLDVVAEIYYLDFKKIRSSEDGKKLYYAPDWGKSYGRVKYFEYPAFQVEGGDASSIFYYKNRKNYTYPAPIYAAAIKSAEIEKQIGEYHLNNLNNNFSGSYIVNFNNGQPTDQQKEEIENQFYDKFVGVGNSGRPVLSFNNSKENETTINKIDSEDWGTKYEALNKYARQNIFTAFRATPNLFGLPTETTGFNSQEYNEAYKIFQRTVVFPIQAKIQRAMDYIFNTDNAVRIKPFKIDEE